MSAIQQQPTYGATEPDGSNRPSSFRQTSAAAAPSSASAAASAWNLIINDRASVPGMFADDDLSFVPRLQKHAHIQTHTHGHAASSAPQTPPPERLLAVAHQEPDLVFRAIFCSPGTISLAAVPCFWWALPCLWGIQRSDALRARQTAEGTVLVLTDQALYIHNHPDFADDIARIPLFKLAAIDLTSIDNCRKDPPLRNFEIYVVGSTTPVGSLMCVQDSEKFIHLVYQAKQELEDRRKRSNSARGRSGSGRHRSGSGRQTQHLQHE